MDFKSKFTFCFNWYKTQKNDHDTIFNGSPASNRFIALSVLWNENTQEDIDQAFKHYTNHSLLSGAQQTMFIDRLYKYINEI